MVEKNCFDMTKLFFQIMCVTRYVTVHGAVVKEFLARADKSGSTPGDAAFCFFCLVYFFKKHYFSFWPFFFILTADPASNSLGSIYILSLSPEFYFGKGISKALDLHTGQAYDHIKTISCQDMSLLLNS